MSLYEISLHRVVMSVHASACKTAMYIVILCLPGVYMEQASKKISNECRDVQHTGLQSTQTRRNTG